MNIKIKAAQVRINPERRLALEKAALEISQKKGQIVKYTDVINYLIDEYLKDAVKDIK